MAFTTLFSTPSVAMPIGPLGPFVSPGIDPAVTMFLALIDVSQWPTGGTDVAAITVEESDDGGTTWHANLGFTIPGGPIQNRAGQTVTVLPVSCSLNFPGIALTLHKLRAGGQILRAVTTGVTIQVQ
jgi:hypothetical protein